MGNVSIWEHESLSRREQAQRSSVIQFERGKSVVRESREHQQKALGKSNNAFHQRPVKDGASKALRELTLKLTLDVE